MSNNNDEGIWVIVGPALIGGIFFLRVVFPWLTDQYMWFFDYNDRSKAYVIVGFIIVLLIAAIFLILYIIDKNEERDKLYKKHLETIEKDRRLERIEKERSERAKKASPHKTEKTKSSKTSKPFKTSTVTHEEDPVYSQDTFNKKDLSSAGFKVVKKAKDD